MTIAGVEIRIMDSSEITRSESLYWRVAVHAPSATPPTIPTAAPMTTRRSETPILVPRIPLTASPLGVEPQSHDSATEWNQER